MELLHVRRARAIWLVDIRDLNPRGLSLGPILSAIKDRYKFPKAPKTPEELTANAPHGVIFGEGSFSYKANEYALAATLYADGFVVDTTVSTRVSDAFLEDLLLFLQSEFSFAYSSKMIQKRSYVSELIVRIEEPFEQAFQRFAFLMDRLNESTGSAYRPFGFTLSADPLLGTRKPTDFRLERELGKAFEEGRYYSLAPLQTEEHTKLLGDLEKQLSHRQGQ
jgi:hypothetical protein